MCMTPQQITMYHDMRRHVIVNTGAAFSPATHNCKNAYGPATKKNFTMIRMVPQHVKIAILLMHMVLQHTYMLRMVPKYEASIQNLL